MLVRKVSLCCALLFVAVVCGRHAGSSSGEEFEKRRLGVESIWPSGKRSERGSAREVPIEDMAGVFFGKPVSMGNYRFCEAVIKVFGINRVGAEDMETKIWDELLLSHEAFKCGINTTRHEVEKQVSGTLRSSKVTFDWKEDRDAYAKHLKEKIGVSAEFFENMLEHLIKVRKLREEVMDSLDPPVSEEEALQEFLNEQNSLSVELVQFDDLEGAEKFYKKARRGRRFWEKEREKDERLPKQERRFRRPGFVALEFLMHMWKLPKEAVYEMIEMRKGHVYPPAPIYKGYAVFKVLKVRRAVETDFPKRRESYFAQIRAQKKFEGFKEWLVKLREEAKINKKAKPLAMAAAGQ